MPEQFRKFYERELIEIKKHRLRIGAMLLVVIVAVPLLIFNGDDSESLVSLKESQAKKIDKTAETNSNSKPEKKSKKSIKILGLDKVSDDVHIVNPFKVTANPTVGDDKPTATKTTIPMPVVKNNPIPQPTLPDEAKPKIVLTLKGTIISDDRKLATIQRTIMDRKLEDKESKNRDENSHSEGEINKTETRLVQIGDVIDDRQIVSIGKDYLEFSDGERLNIFSDDMISNVREGQSR